MRNNLNNMVDMVVVYLSFRTNNCNLALITNHIRNFLTVPVPVELNICKKHLSVGREGGGMGGEVHICYVVCLVLSYCSYKNSTALSTEVWRVKLMDGEPEIKWRVVRKAKAYTPESKRCLLCLAEKFEIANYPGDNLLNKRSEIIQVKPSEQEIRNYYQVQTSAETPNNFLRSKCDVERQ